MTSQGERQNFNWRPNDNSSTTLLRYDQEAEHWVRAFKNAERNNRPTDYKSSFRVFGLFISLVFSLTVLIVLSTIQFIKWLRPKLTGFIN